MVRAFLSIAGFLRSVFLFEVAAAGLFIAACAVQWGLGAALGAGAVCAALKSYDLDAR